MYICLRAGALVGAGVAVSGVAVLKHRMITGTGSNLSAANHTAEDTAVRHYATPDLLKLRTELAKARLHDADAIITTGGTGLGPRDITPETVESFCEGDTQE